MDCHGRKQRVVALAPLRAAVSGFLRDDGTAVCKRNMLRATGMFPSILTVLRRHARTP